MPIKLGIHTGPQNLSMAELHRLWKRADEAGLHWISVWDHFYANTMVQHQRDPCFEAVATMDRAPDRGCGWPPGVSHAISYPLCWPAAVPLTIS
jgi:hypothetical protein